MRRRPSSVLCLGLCVLVVACGVDHGPAGLQDIAERASAERFDGGFAVVVTDRDGHRTTGVAGTLADGSPMTATDPWVIGSVSKTFVATVVMQLVDEGALALGDRAATYVDHAFVPPTATVLDLLHHSSGIPDYLTEEWTALMRSCPAREPHPYDHVATTPLFEPGTDWSYSNVNYLVLGDVVEALTGEPVEVELRRRILDPLGLDATYVQHVESGPDPMAASQDFFDTGPGPLADCQMRWHGGPAPVDGFLVSSAADLDTFYRALFGGELTSADSLAAMVSQDRIGAVHGYGLGLVHLQEPPVQGVDVHGHGGGVVGYRTLVLLERTTMTTVVAVSPNGFGFDDQQDEILEWAFGG